MKTKYLSDDDKRRLRELRHMKDIDEIAQQLVYALEKQYTLHQYKQQLHRHDQQQKQLSVFVARFRPNNNLFHYK